MFVYALQGAGKTSQNSQGSGWNQQLMFTLNIVDVHGVAIVETVTEYTNQISLWEEVPANHSALPDSEKEWMTLVATSPLPTLQSLKSISPNGSFGKMSPVSCHRAEDGTLVPSSGRWMKSGMGTHGECLTLNTPEHPTIRGLCLNDEGVSLLSEILETGVVPQRFYLTPKACAGILRRAEKRGKDLPPLLRQALNLSLIDDPTTQSDAFNKTPATRSGTSTATARSQEH
jgi:hypothetical protein